MCWNQDEDLYQHRSGTCHLWCPDFNESLFSKSHESCNDSQIRYQLLAVHNLISCKGRIIEKLATLPSEGYAWSEMLV